MLQRAKRDTKAGFPSPYVRYFRLLFLQVICIAFFRLQRQSCSFLFMKRGTNTGQRISTYLTYVRAYVFKGDKPLNITPQPLTRHHPSEACTRSHVASRAHINIYISTPRRHSSVSSLRVRVLASQVCYMETCAGLCVLQNALV